METNILNLILQSPILYSSSIFIGVVSLWAFLRAFTPIFKGLERFFIEIVDKEKEKINKGIQESITNIAKRLRVEAKLRTRAITRYLDRFYFLKKSDKANPKSPFRLFEYWSAKSFFISFIVSLLYLSFLLLFIGYYELKERVLWQLLFLIIYYLVILYYSNRLFYETTKEDIKENREKNAVKQLTMVVAGTGAVSMTMAGVWAVAVAGAGAGAGAGAVVVAKAWAKAWAGAWARAWAVVAGAVGAILIIQADVNIDSNIFALLSKLDDLTSKKLLSIFTVFFLIMPLLNALLDSLSIAVSRREFGKLRNSDYTFWNFMKISLIDFIFAISFKIVVLGMLYGSALLLEHTGGTFASADIKAYWNDMLSAIFGSGDLSFLFQNTTNSMITMMISTTLIPTVAHFLIVAINVLFTLLSNILDIIKLLFRGNARFLAVSASVFVLFFMIFIFVLVAKIYISTI